MNMMIFPILLIFALLLLYYYFVIRMKNYWKNRGLTELNKKKNLPSFWHVIFRKKAMADLIREMYDSSPNERYVPMSQFGSPFLIIRDPELLKIVTVKDFDYFTDHKPFIDPESDPVWGRTLMTLTGQKWKEMRGTLSASFTSGKMRIMFGLVKEVADNFIKHFEEKDENVIKLEMKDTFSKFTCDVIATVAFGVTVNSLKNPENEFYTNGKDAMDFTKPSLAIKFFGYAMFPALFKWIKVSLFGAKLTNFFKHLIEESIKIREEKNIVRPDMINILLEAKRGVLKYEENVIDTGFAVTEEYVETQPGKRNKIKNISNEDMISQAVIFFLAGFDSSSNLMSLLAHELTANPDVQQKLRQEVTKTLEECNGDVTYEALLKMKYMDMVITETLRKWPVIIGTDRVCVKPYVIKPVLPHETPLEIREGDVISIPTMGFHRDPKYYPEPMKFDPERFSDENKHKIVPYTFMPFGIGPRSCIASRFALLQTKCIIFYVLSKFEIVATEKTEIPLVLCKKTISMCAKNGIHLGLKRLKKEE